MQNGEGDTALHLSCFRGNERLAHLLLEGGCPCNAQNHKGDTALHVAMNMVSKPHPQGSESMVELLAHYGADMSIKNISGETPMEKALTSDAQRVADRLRKM